MTQPGEEMTEENSWPTRTLDNDDAKLILIGARHEAFVRGVLGREEGYVAAFSTLNTLYVRVKASNTPSVMQKPPVKPRKARSSLLPLGNLRLGSLIAMFLYCIQGEYHANR